MANAPFMKLNQHPAPPAAEPLVLAPMIELLQRLLAAHERLLRVAQARFEAMQNYDLTQLNALLEKEQRETEGLLLLEAQRKTIIAQLRRVPGLPANPSISQLAALSPEPAKSQLLGLSGTLKSVVLELNRLNRINTKVSSGVSAGISKVLGVLTGAAPHAGVYLANGRKARVKGIHLLDAVA